MTQLQMTNPELNRALAERMGYSVYRYDKDVEENSYYMLVDPTGDYQQLERKTEAEAWADAPDYCNDPATSLEVQAAAVKIDLRGYMINISYVCGAEQHLQEHQTSLYYQGFGKVITATPRQMAEAAYMTIQGAQG